MNAGERGEGASRGEPESSPGLAPEAAIPSSAEAGPDVAAAPMLTAASSTEPESVSAAGGTDPEPGGEAVERLVKVDRWAHRRAEPRPLALMWTVYLFIATAMTFAAISGVGGLTLDVYRPALRVLLATVAAGVILVWPMIRLSQAGPAEHPGVASLKDFFAVVVPLQAIVWPQWVLAAWPVDAIGVLAASLTAWAVLSAGVQALYFRWERGAGPAEGDGYDAVRGGPRAAMMVLFVGFAAAGPLLGSAWMLVATGQWPAPAGGAWWMLTSPITAVFELTRDRFSTGFSARAAPAHWAAAANVAVVGAVCWFWSAARGRGAAGVRSEPTNA